jgi:uncharacterized membrane protein
MVETLGGVVNVVLVLAPLSLLAFGLFTFVTAAGNGGLVRGLSRLVLDAARVRRFLAFLSLVVASFLALALLIGIASLLGLESAWVDAGIAVTLLSGCSGLFGLMVGGLSTEELKFEEQLRLNESLPEALYVVAATEHGPRATPDRSMYVVPGLTPLDEPASEWTNPVPGPG